jgi:hypothetical protein
MKIYVPMADVFEYDDSDYYRGSGEEMDGKAFRTEAEAEKYCDECNWRFLLSAVEDSHAWRDLIGEYLHMSEEATGAWEKFAKECQESYPGYSAGTEAAKSWEKECSQKLEGLKGLLLPAMLGPWSVCALDLIDEGARANSSSAE